MVIEYGDRAQKNNKIRRGAKCNELVEALKTSKEQAVYTCKKMIIISENLCVL